MLVCRHCLLSSTDDPQLVLDDRGWCNYCCSYERSYVLTAKSPVEKNAALTKHVADIKKSGEGKKYDCIMGLSGGIDSSYLAYIVKDLGLRPLIVHFDNGWNSELAVKNIENIIHYTGFDLFTYVVDWEEFKDLQLSYIKASVIDWEIPTDHGFFAVLFKMAAKFNIQYVLTGHNHQTEAIMPKPFRWSKMDVANIKDIHKIFGKIKLKTMPLLGFFQYNWILRFKKIQRINLLELVDYDKARAKKIISEKFNWRDYGGKHYESIFTRFYQGYVLMEKFKVDKRKAHLSNLICSGQLTREQALEELSKPVYDSVQLTEDKEYVVKKLGLTMDEFEGYMAMPPVSHLNYASYETGVYRTHEKVMRFLSPLSKLLRRMIK
jgi:N-acetyl sugar amidotransferase